MAASSILLLLNRVRDKADRRLESIMAPGCPGYGNDDLTGECHDMGLFLL